jgi:shikimate kinase
LARVLGWPFVDTDAVVAERAGMSISDIFLTLGEAQFRAWEREAVSDAIGGGAPRVVAVGGGAPMDSHSADLLSEQFTVFLDVSEGVGVRRVGLSGARPLLAASPRARWRELMAERRPVYLWVARHVVHVDTLTPKATATQIARLLGNTAKGKGRGR